MERGNPMTFLQLKNQVLKLLDQYSVAGQVVPSSYNNQQDYLNAIVAFANDAVTEIATTVKKIPVLLDLSTLEPEDLGALMRYELPEDFYQFKSGGTVITTQDGHVLHTNIYKTQDKKYLLIPKEEAGSYSVVYYRYPTPLPESPEDTTELDNDPETHSAVAFYVAAHLVIHDDSFKYASFYNKYEDKLAKMSEGLSAEMDGIGDGYPFSWIPGV